MILHGWDAILRVRTKWLILNLLLQLWADVKYHVPTGFGFSPKARGFYPFGDATSLTTGAKHWHRQKAVFYVFCFCATSIYPLNPDPSAPQKNRRLVVPLTH